LLSLPQDSTKTMLFKKCAKPILVGYFSTLVGPVHLQTMWKLQKQQKTLEKGATNF